MKARQDGGFLPYRSRFAAVLRIAAVVLILLPASGCWDSRQVNDLAIVLSLGIDLADAEDRFLVTYEIVDPAALSPQAQQSPSGGRGGQGSLPLSAEGRSLLEASQRLQWRSSRALFLPHMRAVIIGEDLARQGIGPILDYLERQGEIRRTMAVAVAQGKARELMNASPSIQPLFGIGLGRMLMSAPRVGMVYTIFGDLLEPFSSPGAAAIAPAIRRTGTAFQVQLVGTAVFSGDRLRGFFDERETLGLQILLNRVEPPTIIATDGGPTTRGQALGFQLEGVQTHMEPYWDGDRLRVDVTVRVTSLVLEIMGGEGLTTRAGWRTLEEIQSKAVLSAITAAISRAQEWETDVFLLNEGVAIKYPDLWSQLQPRWPEIFREAEFRVHVTSRITQTGFVKERVPIRRGGQR